MDSKNTATKFDRFMQVAAPFMAAAAVGVLGLQLYSCTANSIVMEFDDVNNADRCLSDVLDNKGTLRLPLPQWKDGATDRLTVYWSRGIAENHAALLTPEVIARCEDVTGQRRNAAWDKALSLRPQQ